MLWVALATAIMLLSGELTREGDGSQAVAELIAGFRRAITSVVPATPRRTQALRAVERFEQAFATHRQDLQAFGACVEAADRKYRATEADYAACNVRIEAQRVVLHHVLVGAQHDYEAALAPAEREQIARVVMALPEARVLRQADASVATGDSISASRFRGVEGVAAQRHLTLPRNVMSIVYGPLGTPTLGQRYPSYVVDGGTTFARHRYRGGTPAPDAPDVWSTRAGVRFGMFDDFEAAALFLPFELSPDLDIDPVLVVFTQQFRFEWFDVGLRASFLTPADIGWSIAPGATLRVRSRRLALHAGVFGGMQVGTVRKPEPFVAGLNAPLRLTYNVLPFVFLSAESGFAYDDLSVPGGGVIPLGFGAGYDWLVGSSLVEFAASFTWDDLLLPKPNGRSIVQFGVYRVTIGASVSFQAL